MSLARGAAELFFRVRLSALLMYKDNHKEIGLLRFRLNRFLSFYFYLPIGRFFNKRLQKLPFIRSTFFNYFFDEYFSKNIINSSFLISLFATFRILSYNISSSQLNSYPFISKNTNELANATLLFPSMNG